jgi:hypothetical protein
MQLTITVDASWLSHPEPLGRLLGHLRALEGPPPPTHPRHRPGNPVRMTTRATTWASCSRG